MKSENNNIYHHNRHIWKDAARNHFAQWADHYDKGIINVLLFNPSYRRVITQLRQWQRRGGHLENMLDIGCGTASLAVNCIKNRCNIKHIAGIDLSEDMLAQAHAKIKRLNLYNKISLINADAENLPFSDNSFDLVTCCNSFHHYPHQTAAIREMHRVLKKDGRLILIDGYRDNPWGYFIFEMCVARVEKHIHHCTSGEFYNYLTAADFADIKQHVFGLCPPALMNTARACK